MNLRKMIVELEEEKSRLDDAILALERLSRSIAKRRGRPPRWGSEANNNVISAYGVDLVSGADGSGSEKPPTS